MFKTHKIKVVLCFLITIGFSNLWGQNIAKFIQSGNAKELYSLSKQKPLQVNGKPLLIHLVQTQNWTLASSLLNLGLNPNPVDTNELSAIMWTIKLGPIPFVKLLLKKAVDCNKGKTNFNFQGILRGSGSSFYGSPLNLAVGYRKDTALVRYMIKQLGFDPNEQEFNSEKELITWTPIFWAVVNNDISMTRYLLELGSNCDEEIYEDMSSEMNFMYPLTIAVQKKNNEIITALFNCNIVDTLSREQAIYSAQKIMVKKNDTAMLFNLLKLNSSRNWFEILAVDAIEINNLDLAYQIVDLIDILDSNDFANAIVGYSLIQRSFYSGDTTLFKKVLSKKPTFYMGQHLNALRLANCRKDKNCVETLKFMIEAGADPFFPLSKVRTKMDKKTENSFYTREYDDRKTAVYNSFQEMQEPLIYFFIDNYREEILKHPKAFFESVAYYPSENKYELLQDILEKLDFKFTLKLNKRYNLIYLGLKSDYDDDCQRYFPLFKKHILNLQEYLQHNNCMYLPECPN